MLAPQEVQKMMALSALGWGSKRIGKALGCSRNTVREYLRRGGWLPMDVQGRAGALEPHREWLAERLRRHRGNADVVRQDLQRELGIEVSLRTVERAVAPLRRELRAEALATIRYETAPGQQLQIDFGSTAVVVGEEAQRVHLFVATLGYSRRCYVTVFLHERQSAWLHGLEGAFRHFGGLPQELLIDNAKALVQDHDAKTREVKFNDRFHAFCRYWDVVPRACAPYRARTKGARTSAASATSSATPLPVIASRASRRCTRTCSTGCARSPTAGSTARPVSRRSCASSGTSGRG
jgi:transposase